MPPKKPHPPRPKPPCRCRTKVICALLKWIVRNLCEEDNTVTVTVTFNDPEPK